MEEVGTISKTLQDEHLDNRPEVLEGRTIKLNTNCGSFFLTLNEHEGKLFEVRCRIGKSGNCQRNLFEIIGILFSILLQSNISRDQIRKALETHMEANCTNTIWHEGERYYSCVDFTVKKMLEEMAARGEVEIE
jgi:ribonucleoside-diphosphate reductase alpha chain